MLLAIGAFAALALQKSRSESLVTMFGKHNIRTFRGKQHRHTFGKARSRKGKRRRRQAIRNGTFDPENVVQRGQPEPQHCWDYYKLVRNKLYAGVPCNWFLEKWDAYHESVIEEYREDWESRMGKRGPQYMFNDWTPPGQEAPPAEDDDPPEPKGSPPAPEGPPPPEPEVPAAEAKEDASATVAEIEPPTTQVTKEGTPEPEAPREGAPAEPASEAKEEPALPEEEPLAEPKAPSPEATQESVVPAEEPLPECEAKEAPVPEAELPVEPEAPTSEATEDDDPPPEPSGPSPAPEGSPSPEPEGQVAEAKDEGASIDAELERPATQMTEKAPLEPEVAKEGTEEGAPAKAELEEPAPAAEGPEPEVPALEATEDSAPSEAEPPAQQEAPASEAAEEPPAAPKPEAKVAAAVVSKIKISAADVKALRERSRAGILDCKKALNETDGDMEKAMDWLRKKGIAKADKKAGNIAVEGNIASYVHFNSKIATMVEVNSETDFVASNAIFKEFANDIAMQIAANPTVTCITADDIPGEVKEKEKDLEMSKEDLVGKPDNIKEKIVVGRLQKKFNEQALLNQKWLKDEDLTVKEVLKERIAKLGENLVIRRFVRLNLGEGLEKKDVDFAAGVEKELAKFRVSEEEAAAAAKKAKEEEQKPAEEKKQEPKEEAKAEVKISAAQVKELRQRSGAGILDSKKALNESGGDIDKAMEWLKKKGMAKADKKAGNLSVEGAIASYVHFNSKLGVIVEVNSETDFVAINAIFKEFAADVAMQLAANPAVVCVSSDEVPEDIKEKEKEIEMNKEDLAGKPENIKEKIVMGRLNKKYEEMSLLNQKWLKDEDKTVGEVLKERIAKLGENIVIRRFERLVLGEGLEKKEEDFAAGVEKELAKYKS